MVPGVEDDTFGSSYSYPDTPESLPSPQSTDTKQPEIAIVQPAEKTLPLLDTLSIEQYFADFGGQIKKEHADHVKEVESNMIPVQVTCQSPSSPQVNPTVDNEDNVKDLPPELCNLTEDQLTEFMQAMSQSLLEMMGGCEGDDVPYVTGGFMLLPNQLQEEGTGSAAAEVESSPSHGVLYGSPLMDTHQSSGNNFILKHWMSYLNFKKYRNILINYE